MALILRFACLLFVLLTVPSPVLSQVIPRAWLPIAIAPPRPPSDLRIVALSGTTTPEHVEVRNAGQGGQDMTGWTLVSVMGPQVFAFPAGYTLTPSATVRIESFTGAVHSPPAVLRWTTAAIWANSGDKAELRNTANGLVSSACYGAGCP